MEVDEFRISDWDKHPNARGHQVMFEALRDAILRARAAPRAVTLAFGPRRRPITGEPGFLQPDDRATGESACQKADFAQDAGRFVSA